jgi:hypothetical protein
MRAAVAIGLVACAPVLAACGTQAAKPLPDDRLQSLVLQPSDLSPTLSRFSFGRELRSEQSPVLSGDPSRFGRQGGWGAAVAADGDDVVIIPKDNGDDEAEAPPSGVVDFRDVNVGSAITECPQAGLRDRQPKPNDLRQKDEVEKLSDAGNNIRFNQDYSCFPQDETSIAVNPADKSNVLGSANDYRVGWGTSGFYASTDNGEHFYDGIRPFPTNANSARDHIDGGGDPSVVFDRGGTAYYNDLHFMRENDESGIFVARSTNGGFTWSRPCIPAGSTDAAARCGGNGDVRRPGDGVVA